MSKSQVGLHTHVLGGEVREGWSEGEGGGQRGGEVRGGVRGVGGSEGPPLNQHIYRRVLTEKQFSIFRTWNFWKWGLLFFPAVPMT